MAVASITNKLADFLFATKRLMLGRDRVRRYAVSRRACGRRGSNEQGQSGEGKM